MEELISVIVPVYKVEKFLDQCIDSIVSQTYRKIEIILVDDGSPDKCPDICEYWKERDTRIKVIHQENSGGGIARNRGLDLAQGEFIVFVDSDDYIAPTMLEFLYAKFEENVDIVECGYCVVQDEKASFEQKEKMSTTPDITQVFHAEEAMRENIRDHIFRQIIWNKMYRKSVIGKIRFPEGRKIDDEFWTYQVIGNARKLVWTDRVLYAYRQQKNSVMHSISAEKRMEGIVAKTQRHVYLCEKMPSLEEESLCSLWFSCLYQGQFLLKNMRKTDRSNAWEQLKQILLEYPIKDVLPSMYGTKKMWLKMEEKSFYLTCRIRNLMKKGL